MIKIPDPRQTRQSALSLVFAPASLSRVHAADAQLCLLAADFFELVPGFGFREASTDSTVLLCVGTASVNQVLERICYGPVGLNLG